MTWHQHCFHVAMLHNTVEHTFGTVKHGKNKKQAFARIILVNHNIYHYISCSFFAYIRSDAIYIPLIAYSDEANVKRSRGGQGVHPIRIVPTGLPLKERLRDCTKLTLGYISQGASQTDAFRAFCKLQVFLFDNTCFIILIFCFRQGNGST